MIVSAVIFLLALVMAGLAIWLFIYADSRERHDQLQLRLRAGEQAGATPHVSMEARLRNPVLRAACKLIWRTGVEVEPPTVAKILMVLAAIVPLAILLFGWFGGGIIVSLLLAFGYGILRNRAARRRRQIVSQMPGFLEAAMRVQQAGNTLEESIASAAEESEAPLRPLFESVGRQVRLGAPLDQVLVDAAEMHGVRDLRVMALAAAINRRYGGSLRNVFRSLIAAIRQRDSAARELRALTAETRFSALVLAVIPAALTTYIYIQNQTYYAQMWESTGGRITLIAAVALQVIGVVVIYRMMRATEGDEA